VDPDGQDWFTSEGRLPLWINCESDPGGCDKQQESGWSRWAPKNPGDTLLVDWMDGTFRLGVDKDGNPTDSYSGPRGLEPTQGPIEGLFTSLGAGFLRGAAAGIVSSAGRNGAVQFGEQRLLDTARDNVLQGAKTAKLQSKLAVSQVAMRGGVVCDSSRQLEA